MFQISYFESELSSNCRWKCVEIQEIRFIFNITQPYKAREILTYNPHFSPCKVRHLHLPQKDCRHCRSEDLTLVEF
jgi:hypothetical protein